MAHSSIADDLAAFSAFVEREGLPPTVREFQFEADLSSTSVAQYHLGRLSIAGFIERRNLDGDSRSWRLTSKGVAALKGTA